MKKGSKGLNPSSAALDQMKELREKGFSWEKIAQIMGFSRVSAQKYGKRVVEAALALPLKPQAPEEKPKSVFRDALPAGHPDTWGLLVAGTILADSPYGDFR